MILFDKLQVLQNKAARVIVGCKFENTNHPVLLKELHVQYQLTEK